VTLAAACHLGRAEGIVAWVRDTLALGASQRPHSSLSAAPVGALVRCVTDPVGPISNETKPMMKDSVSHTTRGAGTGSPARPRGAPAASAFGAEALPAGAGTLITRLVPLPGISPPLTLTRPRIVCVYLDVRGHHFMQANTKARGSQPTAS